MKENQDALVRMGLAAFLPGMKRMLELMTAEYQRLQDFLTESQSPSLTSLEKALRAIQNH